jgi:hypothetical protein
MSGTTGGSDGSVDPQEYFARALERDRADAGDSDDPPPDIADDLALVERLRELGEQTPREAPDTPTDAERDRMRARILSGARAPAPQGDPVPAAPAAAPEPSRRSRSLRGVMAAAVCLLITVSASSLLFSGDALPGDPLYGIKRTMEHASLTLSFGEKSTGFTHLEMAGNRVDEVRSLLDRDSTAPAELYVRALSAFDAETAAGSRALTAVGTNAAGSALTSLRQWSSRQYRRLTALTGDLPPGAVPASRSSLTLVDRVAKRTAALRDRFSCRSITSGRHDELGPLPETGACSTSPRPVDPYASQAPLPPKPPRRAAPPSTTVPAPAPEPAPEDPRVLADPQPQVAPRHPAPVPRPAEPLPTRVPVPDAPEAPPVSLPLPVDLGSITVPGVVSLGLG